ncbi:MAG: enoyl-CoA hydratase/isomerase family protein [Actinobacteria bacterium]|nr:enoyl-CoA hydratase/isomerase family protein [Actinomycetota bacterium]
MSEGGGQIDFTRYERYLEEGIAFDEPRPGVLRLQLTRSDRWNAIPIRLHDSMPLLFAEIAEDQSVRAFMIAGTGDVFSSGGDVDEGMKPRHAGQLALLQYTAVRIITRLLEIPQPTIAVVNGPAIGFAVSLALHCDFVIASENATFYDSHAAFGAAPGDGYVVIAQAALPPAIAKDVLYGGRTLTAAEAEHWGLVNRVAPREQLEEEAFAQLARVFAMAPLAVRMGKMFANAELRARAEQTLNMGLAAELLTIMSDDFNNAVEGFFRTRKFTRDWKGR